MHNVKVSSAAEQDFTEALTWYIERSVQAAERFEAEFQNALQSIAADPQRFPRCGDNLRYASLRRYPFQVIFRELGNHLLIIAVAHAKRDPEYWSGR
jgi:plasmid stabilization system protein ParE